MSYPYDEAKEIFRDWTDDLDNPISVETTEYVRCPICFEEIKMNGDSDEEIYADGCHSYCDIYHKDCVQKSMTLDVAFKFLDSQGELKEYFNWYYGDELVENPIEDLSFKLKMALINQYTAECINDNEGLITIRQYIEEYLIDDYIKWLGESEKDI